MNNTALKYLFFGGSAFLLDFGSLWILKSHVGLPAWLASTIAFCVSTIFAFLTQQRITFKSQQSTSSSLIKYGFLLVVNAVFTSAVVQLFDYFWQLYLAGKILATALTTIWNYFLMKHWIFPGGAGSIDR